jgi:hypothetical protein
MGITCAIDNVIAIAFRGFSWRASRKLASRKESAHWASDVEAAPLLRGGRKINVRQSKPAERQEK